MAVQERIGMLVLSNISILVRKGLNCWVYSTDISECGYFHYKFYYMYLIVRTSIRSDLMQLDYLVSSKSFGHLEALTLNYCCRYLINRTCSATSSKTIATSSKTIATSSKTIALFVTVTCRLQVLLKYSDVIRYSDVKCAFKYLVVSLAQSMKRKTGNKPLSSGKHGHVM